jgi:flagellar motor switch protein FliM
VVVTTTFDIEFGSVGGEFHICMPYSMIEPMRDQLSSPLQGETLEVDKRWVRLLSQQVQAADVEIVTNLAQIDMTLSQLLNMRVGDVIPLDVPEVLEAKVDGVPVMHCNYGVFNGQYALRVNQMINHSHSDYTKDNE